MANEKEFQRLGLDEDFDISRLSDDDKDTLDFWGMNGQSSSYQSNVTVAPKSLSSSDVALALEAIELRRELIDQEVRAKIDDPEAQVTEIKARNSELDGTKRKLEAIQKRLERDDTQSLREKGGRDYAMYTDEGNVAVTKMMDEVLKYAEDEYYALKDRVAARVRELMAEVAGEFGEIYDSEVREAIYADLVENHYLEAFEPLDI